MIRSIESSGPVVKRMIQMNLSEYEFSMDTNISLDEINQFLYNEKISWNEK